MVVIFAFGGSQVWTTIMVTAKRIRIVKQSSSSREPTFPVSCDTLTGRIMFQRCSQ